MQQQPSSQLTVSATPGSSLRLRASIHDVDFAFIISACGVKRAPWRLFIYRQSVRSLHAKVPCYDATRKIADNKRYITINTSGCFTVFAVRLWRTVKYEEVYLRAYENVLEARASIGRYVGFYNSRRPHLSLDGKTPDQAYFNLPVPIAAAA